MRSLRPTKKSDAIALTVLAIFGLFLLSLPFLPVPKHHFNWGFGSNWACTNQGIDVTCLRK
jgi:hypothetical protein